MAANEACPRGNEITSTDRCREAGELGLSLGLNPQRDFQTGNWHDVPFQCSTEIKGTVGDETFHFNSNDQTDNSRFTNGDFLMICEKGE